MAAERFRSAAAPSYTREMSVIDDGAALVALKDWSNAVGTYWSFYSAVGLGAVGFAINMAKDGATQTARALIVAGFLLFALGNHVALIRSHAIMLEVSTALRARAEAADNADARPGVVQREVLGDRTTDPGAAATPAEYRRIMKVAPPAEVWRVRTFHITMTLLIAIVIWFASRPRDRND